MPDCLGAWAYGMPMHMPPLPLSLPLPLLLPLSRSMRIIIHQFINLRLQSTTRSSR